MTPPSAAPAASALADALSVARPARARRDAFRRAQVGEAGVEALIGEVSRLRRRDPEGAVGVARTVLAAARAARRTALAGRASEALGNALLSLGRPREALRRLRIAADAENATGRAGIAPGIAHALAVLGRSEEATEVLSEARSRLPARGSPSLRAMLDASEGNLLERLDRPREALRALDRARDAFRRMGTARHAVAAVDLNRANLLSNLDRHVAAERLYRRVARYHRAGGREAAALQADYNRAYLSYLRGAYHDALTRFDALRARFEETSDRRHAALCDLDTAEVHLRLNLPAEARVRADRAAAAFDALGISQDAARARLFSAVAVLALEGPFTGAPALERARDELARLGCVAWEAIALHRLAEAHREAGKRPEAREAAGLAAVQLEALGLRERAGRATVLLATIDTEDGDPAGALRRLEVLRARTRDLHAPWLSCEASHRASLASTALGRRHTAALHALRAARTLERHRVGAPPDEYMAAFLRDKAAVHANAIRCVLALGGRRANALAFELAEEGRGRALLDLLLRRRPRKDEATPLVREAERLAREIDGLVAGLPAADGGTRGPAADVSAHSSVTREARLRRCLDLLAVRDPAAAGARGGTALRLREALAALPADTTVVEYVLDGDDLIAFVLRRGRLDVVRHRCARGELRRAIERARFHLDRPPLVAAAMGPEAEAALAASAGVALDDLGARLLGPVSHLLDARRIVVVPHAETHGVPFPALSLRGKALLEDHEVVVAPSVAIYLRCLARTPARADHCVALGVPDAAAPRLGEEARRVVALHGKGRAFVGRTATRASLVRHAADARLIHVASHGRMREDDPMLSGLLLADGWLTIGDLYGLRLRAETVVLSGCATGRAWVSEGDECFGLVRGFLHAGARDVVGSLWRVSDVTAAEFMTGFHRALAAGASPAAALRSTALDLRRRHPHPHDWAPFVLHGAGGALAPAAP